MLLKTENLIEKKMIIIESEIVVAMSCSKKPVVTSRQKILSKTKEFFNELFKYKIVIDECHILNFIV